MSSSQVARKVSYYAKDESECPVCGFTHNKEEMLSGGGRLIADKIAPDLRRLYKPSPKYGTVIPLSYVIQVCPQCLYAAYAKDFKNLSEEERKAMEETVEYRKKLLDTLFGELDFKKPRDLILGAASFILAIDCYHLRDKKVAPTVKKAVSSIRAAWLLDDLYAKANYRPYDKVRDFYFMQSAMLYFDVLDILQSGKESMDQAVYMLGPDLDHNWGYDGVIYLNSYLTHKFIEQLAETPEKKYELLDRAKRHLSKLYGTGKSDKSKPNLIVDMAKDLYDEIGELLNSLKESAEDNT